MNKFRCSELPRIALCPGSYRACRGVESPGSSASDSGVTIHKAIEDYYRFGKEINEGELTDREAFVARWFTSRADKVIEDGSETAPEVHRASLLGDGVLLSGHIDLESVSGESVAVFDWKTGFKEVPTASQNIQLKGYVVLEAEYHEVNSVKAYLFSTGNDDSLTGVEYGVKELEEARQYLKNLCLSALADNAPRCPSQDACQYCQAQCTTRCPETLEEMCALPARVSQYELLPPKADCRDIFNAIKMVDAFKQKFISALKAAVTANPDEWADTFVMKSTGKQRTVTSANDVFDIIVRQNGLMTPDEFLSMVKVPITGIEKGCKAELKAQNIKVKDQKQYLADILGDLVEYKDKAPKVEVVKE